MTKLNPCPQCGNEPELNVGHIESWVVCRSCGVAVANGAATGDAAINSWNDVAANFTQSIKTLRDEFAITVLGSVYTHCVNQMDLDGYPDESWRNGIAKDAYAMADAMIKERSK